MQKSQTTTGPGRRHLRQLPGLRGHNSATEIQLLAPVGGLRQQKWGHRPRHRAAPQHHRNPEDVGGGGGIRIDHHGAALQEAQPGQEETPEDEEVRGRQDQEVPHDRGASSCAELSAVTSVERTIPKVYRLADASGQVSHTIEIRQIEIRTKV